MCDENVNFSTLKMRVLKFVYVQKNNKQFLIAPTAKRCCHLHHLLLGRRSSVCPEGFAAIKKSD